jgi:hypothetical protein
MEGDLRSGRPARARSKFGASTGRVNSQKKSEEGIIWMPARGRGAAGDCNGARGSNAPRQELHQFLITFGGSVTSTTGYFLETCDADHRVAGSSLPGTCLISNNLHNFLDRAAE